jgi:two-component system OmpR family response regulator
MADSDRTTDEAGSRSTASVILHVEDEEPNRALLRAVFGRTSVEIVRKATLIEAPDLETARRLLEQEPVDLVLLDVRLPDGNGLELARSLRDRGPRRPVVIVMSASVLPSERDTAIMAGADYFLAKPYVPSELVGLVAEELRRSES